MRTNNVELKAIDELLKSEYQFYIPSYQRGYRWNKQQVTDLLEDIWDFSNKKKQDEFYCLQPIVVKQKELDSGDVKWEVIDGQQRLTTIYIILYYINNRIFQESDAVYSLEYETRAESEDFLKSMDEGKKDDNIDFFHIYKAFEYVVEWFKSKGNVAKIATKIYPILLDSTQVIWYQINDNTDAIDIFTRINLGKIPLTNAELIKALFLKKDNFIDSGDSDKIRLKQLEIASEWDRIEYALQNDEFWYFLNNGEKEYETRIEFIFDMMSQEINNTWPDEEKIKKENNDYFSFLVFSKMFKEEEKNIKDNNLKVSPIEGLWIKIKRYYMTFEEWFSNRELYHMIGYLVSTDVPIEVIKDETHKMTKTQLGKYLNERIKKSLNLHGNIDEIYYDSNKDKKKIKNILLLFNIISLRANKKSNIRFPFDRYKLEEWDIEHIHAVHSEMPNDRKHRTDWLNAVKDEIDNPQIINLVQDFLQKEDIAETTSFEQVYSKILEQYGEKEDINDISNLTLLDAATNRSYKNAVFPIKRKKILTNDKEGTFIPLCTKNVFLKYYSDDIKQMTFWGNDDRQKYLEAIIETLKEYLPSQKRGISNGD